MLIKIKNKKQNKLIVSEKLYIRSADTINYFRSSLACCEVGGWFPPSDNSGKIFVTVRNWTTDQHHTQPTYDDAEDFM